MLSRLNEILLFRNLITYFWISWLGILTLSNGVDCLQIFGFVHHEFPFSANNFELLVDFTATYGFSDLTNQVLFVSYTLVLLSLFGLLLKGLYQLLTQDKQQTLHKGFLYGIILSAISILIDEVFINYDTEQNHLVLLIAQLLSFFMLLKLTEMKQELLAGKRT